jgi:hypothetical protein
MPCLAFRISGLEKRNLQAFFLLHKKREAEDDIRGDRVMC